MTDDKHTGVGDGFDRVAAGWERWTRVSSQRNAGRYFDAAAIGRGNRVLEIGAGTGDQTVPLARFLGPEGGVVAVDLSSEIRPLRRHRVDTPPSRRGGVWEEALHDPEPPAASLRRVAVTLGRQNATDSD